MRTVRRQDEPRISLSKLAEYLSAKPGRRQTIIRNQKKPKDCIVARYTAAERAIQNYIANEERGPKQIELAIESILSSPHDTDWKQETADLCTKALFAFMSIADEVPTNGFTPTKGEETPEKMYISGVKVSVRPEILLVDKTDKTKFVGAIKFYIVKNNPLTDESGALSCAILYRYLAEVISNDKSVSFKNCFVVDVFAGKIYTSPKSFKRHMNDAAAACTEIFALWPLL